ncbi:MAG: ParB/RepB/Spo0J family partition protein [Candidatus Puniceispirillaceae bacterium]
MSDTNKSKSSAKPAKGLGRGLSSLLGDAATTATLAPTASPSAPAAVAHANDIRLVPVEWINPGPWQPRRIFDRTSLDELAASMQANGVVQPILVRPNPDKAGRYQLIAGERRWRAAQIAQLHDIPTIIRDFDDKQAAEISLIENIQRSDLSAIEEAAGYRVLIDNHGYTQDELANLLGKSRPHLSNMMRLLALPDDVQQALLEKKLTAGQVRPLIGHDKASEIAKRIIAEGLSARDVEKLVRTADKKPAATSEKTSDIKALEKKSQDVLGLKMTVNWDEASEKGVVKFQISNFDQLDMLLAKLGLNDS